MSQPATTAVLPGNIIRRTYGALAFSPNKPLTLDLYRDATLLKIQVRVSGYITTTWASGSPVTNPFATLGALVERIDLVVNGSRVVKSIQPYFGSLMHFYTYGQKVARKSSAAASAATGSNPTADGPFAFGSTTNLTTASEALEIPLVDMMAAGNLGSMFALNLRRTVSAQLRFTCNSYSSLQKVNDTSPVVYTADNVTIQVTTEEAMDIDAVIDLKQTYKYKQYSAQANNDRVELPVGGIVRGIGLLVRDGGAARDFSNNALRGIQLFDGNRLVVDTTFQDHQDKNKGEQAGLYAPFASNVSPVDGFIYLKLCKKDMPFSGWDLRSAKQAFISFGTAASGSGATYSTNPMEILIAIDEYMPIPGVTWDQVLQ